MAVKGTFAIPLKKRTDFSFKSGLDYKTIREGYDKLCGNPFGIKPDPPQQPIWYCDATFCTFWRNPNLDITGGMCSGACNIG